MESMNYAHPCRQYQTLVYRELEHPMGKNTSFSLGEHFSEFVEAQVGQGRYSSASDVVRAGLRLLEEQEARLAVLRAALIEGEQSGPSTAFDFEAFITRKRTPPSQAG
jgi:antitoxin ParD1/3/4